MARQRRIYGRATLFSTVVLYTLYSLRRFVYPAWDDATWYDVVWDINAFCLTWFSVVATVAYGYQYLNRPHPVLSQLNEAVYPFYILHQTVIVVIGFYILKYNIGVWPGFLLVSTLSLLISIGLYWLIIKRIKILRVFFGLK